MPVGEVLAESNREVCLAAIMVLREGEVSQQVPVEPYLLFLRLPLGGEYDTLEHLLGGCPIVLRIGEEVILAGLLSVIQLLLDLGRREADRRSDPDLLSVTFSSCSRLMASSMFTPVPSRIVADGTILSLTLDSENPIIRVSSS